jgi:hypothetical protein
MMWGRFGRMSKRLYLNLIFELTLNQPEAYKQYGAECAFLLGEMMQMRRTLRFRDKRIRNISVNLRSVTSLSTQRSDQERVLKSKRTLKV